jgi:predicted DNA-binding protein
MTKLVLIRLEIVLRMAKSRLDWASSDESKVKWYLIHSAIEDCIHQVRVADAGARE